MSIRFPKIFRPSDWLEKQQGTILSAAAIITVANLLSSLSGLIRQRLLIAEFFDTPVSRQAYEAFLIAFQIPDLMFQLIVLGAVSAAFIPMLVQYKNQPEKTQEYVNLLLTSILLIFMVGAAVVFIFAEPLTKLRTGPAFTPEQLQIAVNLTRLMLVAQFFFATSNLITGYLQSAKRFIMPALAPIMYNLGILFGAYALSAKFGIYAAGIGVIIGSALHLIIQLPLAYKLGWRFRPQLNFHHSGLRRTYKLMPARVLTLGISQLQQLATGFFTTSIGSLSFVIMNLAFSLMTMPIRFFGVPISQAALPFLADQAEDKNLHDFRESVIRAIQQISFFAYPAAVLLVILRIPIVRLAYGTKNFPWETTVLTGSVVAIISLSVGAQAITQLIIRAFHALKDTKTPLIAALLTTTGYIFGGGYLALSLGYGVVGLAIAASLVNVLETGLLLWMLDRKISGINNFRFWLPQAKMLLASFILAVSLFLPLRVLDRLVFNTTKTVELILLTITVGTIGMSIYILLAVILNIRELYIIDKVAATIGSWRKTLSQTTEVIVETPAEGDEL